MVGWLSAVLFVILYSITMSNVNPRPGYRPSHRTTSSTVTTRGHAWQHLMVEVIRPALVAMRAGILDALPSKALEGLTAEDFRLLLNGCHAIDVDLLERCTEFMDETGRSGSLMQTTRGWFWEVVRTMSTEEQHDLVYFWTSSPSLPATEAGLVPRPKILVRPASDGDAGLLPTANTCISRLSIPAYPTKEILKDKLLMAIQTKTFGFV